MTLSDACRKGREKIKDLFEKNRLKAQIKAQGHLIIYAYGPNRTDDPAINATAAGRHQRRILKPEEAAAIDAIRRCRSPAELMRAAPHLMEESASGQLMYIHTAVTHIVHLWRSNILEYTHGEDWYRVNVYSMLWDAAFLDSPDLRTIRSENKPLLLLGRKLHTTRVDFIYRHYPREQDILFAEEKKDGSGVTEDLLKCDRLRVAHLHHWASQAATEYKDVADEYLESVSLQWAGLTASLYGSRRFVLQATNNTQPAILHYEKSTFAVPASPEDPIAYNQLADCLSTAISVQREGEIISEMLQALDDAKSVPKDYRRTADSMSRMLHKIQEKYSE
ncbi:hypothetical protein BCR43DRAFT_519370 [Syncephalastrum racemosum]|uniref:Uncharacterized protein n=1 Tax=Syncephalastrum racemosum TaxID=13706 RepID=A0A1X2GYW0_SYNRA|nr:hypothetical protein BCR43DRAFT_519453 [Syncephalastrum racemosum]ORY89495.1 hypothetical protein BCR43DRAFT_519370 [Syncephalastrum racemosum]